MQNMYFRSFLFRVFILGLHSSRIQHVFRVLDFSIVLFIDVKAEGDFDALIQKKKEKKNVQNCIAMALGQIYIILLMLWCSFLCLKNVSQRIVCRFDEYTQSTVDCHIT